MIREAISLLIAGKTLSMEQAADVMSEIMNNEATPAQFGAFVTALRLKGEAVAEIAGLAQTMRSRAIRVIANDNVIVDTAGTGGDNAGTFNISTAAAFVAAGAGAKMAKHGNRAMSSQCGSADVLEALGAQVDLTAEEVQRSLNEVGIAFMLASAFHPAMRFAAGPRKEIGIRNIFNILGPLANPAGAQHQVIGVPELTLTEKLARVLQILGSAHALIVHGTDGLDEITITDKTHICELKNGSMTNYDIAPEDFGLMRAGAETLKGGNAAQNASLLRDVLAGREGPQRDVVLLNAAAALLAGDIVPTFKDGVTMAAQSIDSGSARQKLEQFIVYNKKEKAGDPRSNSAG